MTAVEVLSDLRARGISVEPRPNGNLFLAPKANLTPELIERVRQHKAALLERLTADRERAETARIARLDDQRREADRQAGRGYDVDCSHPDHAEYLSRTGQHCPCQDAPGL